MAFGADWPAFNARSAIALISRRRLPNETPSFSRSPSVSSGRISRSISFASNASAYCSNLFPRNQSRRSLMYKIPQTARAVRLDRHFHKIYQT
jgi:hypothetical protein